MLWLIQRDFLQGKTVTEMVDGALAEQPNPLHNKDIDQVGFSELAGRLQGNLAADGRR